jgi:hypothetical protein
MRTVDILQSFEQFNVLHVGSICDYPILSIPHPFIYPDKWRCSMTEQDGYMFERKFLDIVEELREKKKISKKALAGQVFPFEKDPNKKYHTILKGDSKAKPQRLKLGEAYEIAKYLQVPFDTISQEAIRRITFE